jgi:hypothetical protein
MSASEEPSRGGSSAGRSSAGFGMPSEKTLLVAIAVAFLILHIVAGAILLGPTSEPIAPQPASLSSGD